MTDFQPKTCPEAYLQQKLADLRIELDCAKNRVSDEVLVLKAKKEALEKKLAEQQAVIVRVYVMLNSCEESDNPNHGVSEVIRKLGKTDPVEMDKLLAAARQQGFEEGKQTRNAPKE